MNNAPIGVFDSGLGGLTVWRELYRKLPHESLIYYGDGKNCPYGDKNREEVTAYVDLAVRRLIDRGVKLIVVACNAATAMAIDHLRRNYALPLVGLEPAVKPAAMASRKRPKRWHGSTNCSARCSMPEPTKSYSAARTTLSCRRPCAG